MASCGTSNIQLKYMRLKPIGFVDKYIKLVIVLHLYKTDKYALR